MTARLQPLGPAEPPRISAHWDFKEGTYRFGLSTDQSFGCHNRMIFLRISAPTIGSAVRFGSWRYLIST